MAIAKKIYQIHLPNATRPLQRISAASMILNVSTCWAQTLSSMQLIQLPSPITQRTLSFGSPLLPLLPYMMPGALMDFHNSNIDCVLPKPQMPSTIFAFFASYSGFSLSSPKPTSPIHRRLVQELAACLIRPRPSWPKQL